MPPIHPSSSVGPCLQRLRDRTASAHARLESVIDLDRLGTSREYYRETLTAFASFLAGWRPRLLAALAPGDRQWYVERDRWPMLRADLADLGQSEPEAAAEVPDLGSSAAAWGSLYVIEGSALGGRVIVRQLGTAGHDVRYGTAWFEGWGERTAERWKAFRDRLELRVRGTEIDLAVEAANQTFARMQACLQRHHDVVVG